MLQGIGNRIECEGEAAPPSWLPRDIRDPGDYDDCVRLTMQTAGRALNVGKGGRGVAATRGKNG